MRWLWRCWEKTAIHAAKPPLSLPVPSLYLSEFWLEVGIMTSISPRTPETQAHMQFLQGNLLFPQVGKAQDESPGLESRGQASFKFI